MLPGKVFTLLLLLAGSLPVFAQPEGDQFSIRRGTNISHWLSQSGARGKERAAYFTEKDVAFIARQGFDHLRLPVDEEQLWNEKGEKDRQAFELLHQALQWCYLYRIRAVVDLHILRSHHFNSREKPLWTQPAAQERLLQCWRDLSAELKRYPNNMVAYELMNEPVADSAAQWNQLAARCIQAIRELEPQRVIIVGSNRWQSIETLPELEVPADDPNIILSFHFYKPFYLTHYMASWTNIDSYKGPVHYPGPTITVKELEAQPASIRNLLPGASKPYNTDSIAADIQVAVRAAQRRQLRLYCGEWGCLSTVPRKDRLRWYKDVRKVLEQNNIAWSNWDYKGGGFGIIGKDGEPDKGLLRVLVK